MADDTSSPIGELTKEFTDTGRELERIEGLSERFGKSLSAGFRAAITDGKSFRSVLNDIARGFTDLALKSAFRPVEMLASGLIDNLFKATDPALHFAKGGVLSAPAYFPLSGGLGLAGEAGPEAILPLRRGADGRLGVASGAGAPISISVNVTTRDAQSFVGAEAELSAMLLRAVKRGTRAS